MNTKLLAATLLAASLLSGVQANAQSFDLVAQSNQSTLNDLIRPIPVQSRRFEQNLSVLSAVQEQVILHERRMRGEGLPPVYRAHLSANYSGILNALIDDRITESYGRELLDVHRQLVEKAYCWSLTRAHDEEYGKVLIEGLKEVGSELVRNAEPLAVVPDSLRTPLLNGHQLWMEELLVWGIHCNRLSLGDLSRVDTRVNLLEYDERAFKRDGCLSKRERERLHARLFDLQRTVIEVLER